jgi:NAD(P)H-dependent FMN reductase
MSGAKRALLFVGSPNGKGSTSDRLGSAVMDKLGALGVTGEKLYAYSSIATPQGRQAIIDAVARADVVLFSYPLYIDSIPAGMIEAMELMAGQRSGSTGGGDGSGNGDGSVGVGHGSDSGKKRLAVIVQCGFPEARHNEISIAICKEFANEAGFAWVGGLGIGEGPATSRMNFSGQSGMGGGLKKALALMADALAKGEGGLPREAVELAAKPALPVWLYRFIGSRQFRGEAKKNKAKLEARPLIESRKAG